MTKISFDPEQGEINVTRSIGKNGDGKITINREGGGSVQINLGIGSIGLTSDYGGGINLGIGGQEITWGREGGTIHIGIGGFNVDVEARDCIVTEIKSIAGIIVAQRSYPDPGCKSPDPPKSESDEPIRQPSSNNPNGIITRKKCTGGRLELVGNAWSFSDTQDRIYPLEDALARMDVVFAESENYRKEDEDAFADRNIGVNRWYIVTRTGSQRLRSGNVWHWVSDSNTSYYGSPGTIYFIAATCVRTFQYDVYLHKGGTVENPGGYWFTSPGYNAKSIIVSAPPPPECPFPPPKIPKQFLPTGNKPPMRNCCEEVLDYLADFEEAFDIQRLLKDKFAVSNTFMAPECDPASVTIAKSYYEILQCAFRMMAHGMIFEPKVMIKDADAAKAGDQEFKAKYLNATGWASAVAEALLEVKDDGNVGTNMDIRSSFASTQTMVGVAEVIYKLEAILDCMGIKLAPKVETVETPFNLMIQIGKGFGENNERQIDLNQDEATEALLPQLLQTKSNKIKSVTIHPRSRTIHDILDSIEASLSAMANG